MFGKKQVEFLKERVIEMKIEICKLNQSVFPVEESWEDGFDRFIHYRNEKNAIKDLTDKVDLLMEYLGVEKQMTTAIPAKAILVKNKVEKADKKQK